MQTVVETAAYLRAAKVAGIADDEREAIVSLVAANPEAGEIMVGCGGARKLRFARQGVGKSGSHRVITYFAGELYPVFLLTVFPKNLKANLSQAERNAFAAATKRLTEGLAK